MSVEFSYLNNSYYQIIQVLNPSMLINTLVWNTLECAREGSLLFWIQNWFFSTVKSMNVKTCLFSKKAQVPPLKNQNIMKTCLVSKKA